MFNKALFWIFVWFLKTYKFFSVAEIFEGVFALVSQHLQSEKFGGPGRIKPKLILRGVNAIKSW